MSLGSPVDAGAFERSGVSSSSAAFSRLDGRSEAPPRSSYASRLSRDENTRGFSSSPFVAQGESLKLHDTDEDGPDFARPEVFEDMVGDLRRTFIGWLKRTDADLKRERANLILERQRLKKERERMWEEFSKEKTSELEVLSEERKRLHAEAAGTMKQIAVERDDARRRLDEERTKCEQQFKMWKRRLALEREQFFQEVEAFEEERRKIADASMATQSMVEINVGGVVFETSKTTLTQQPGSILEALVSGRHELPRDKNGRIFLDRDAELFRIILQFLRDLSVPPCPRDATESMAICNEAAYYGIKFFPFPLVFALGGYNGVDHMNSVEFLDVAERCWRPCSSMETARTYAGYAELSGRVVAFGGQNLDYRSLCDCECYDVLRDQWTGAPPMNHPRKNLGSVAHNSRVYAIGGYDGANILSSVEAYDLRMKSWLELAPLNTPRSAAACVAAGDSIWALGGSKGERLKTIERYEPRMDSWETLSTEMLEVRSAACAAAHLGYLYVFGGTDNAHATHASVEALDLRSSKSMFCQPMPEPRMDAAAVVTSGSVLIAGGQNETVLSNTVFFRPDLEEWKAGANMTVPRHGHGLLVANL